ncbi:chitobiase/beta-hexosaminidase C-terminal domain-containing protein [Halobacillus amylolyticus]|uniref:Chitobiase/beta-hexosaminidase C-terminal domain-containing protein n=1 Tax=Halobacillus amylolyticus TaxID=2932259 RepID=A0ABY4H9T0_9BACI|nr:chitobiase/beta-hexosaminidase C-terminal domain-containing protein [Halobacillus amylolyticus]UOR11619.1 chitobiase/beta-hexosaminidase C-terminal domain-containing protein [Halobacillus amylolyticus]
MRFKKTVVTGLAAVLALSPFSSGLPQSHAAEVPSDLFFSEYIEGSSYNKAIELYNGTDGEVNLSGYTIEMYANGSLEPTGTFDLSGTLASGEVFVAANSRANEEILASADATNNSAINFNGNDPIVLKKDGAVVDSIGQIGSEESFAGDVTLVRKESVTAGDTNTEDTFDTTKEWDSYAKDTTEYLGSYQMTDVPPVELQSIAEARASEPGSTVKVQGVATAAFNTGGQTNLYIQDETGGIIVRAPGLSAEVGDVVSATGEFSAYYGMQQILASTANVDVVTPDAGVPTPEKVTSQQFSQDNGEAIEGEFVQVGEVEVLSKNSYGDFTVQDESGTFTITPNDENALEVGKTYEQISGVVNYSFNEYKLVPRNDRDIVEEVFAVQANPTSGSLVIGEKVELYTAQPNGTIHYTTDGSEPNGSSEEYTEPIAIEQDTTLKAVVVKESGEVSPVASFDYTVLKPFDDVDIHDIQGASHTSPYEGNVVEDVEGVVTKLDGTNGFYMQSLQPDDNVATSEGIYVYDRSGTVKVGDHVEVAGEVTEWREEGYYDAEDLLTTQISASEVNVLADGIELPDPIVLGVDRQQPTEVIENDGMESFDAKEDGLDFYESLEGMLIGIEDATVAAPVKYEELAVYGKASEDQKFTRAEGLLITPDDYNPERLLIDVDGLGIDAVTGDYFNEMITGVVSYDYSNFKIRPTGEFPDLMDGGTEREVTELESSNQKLTVASYNVENFSAASDPEKAARLGEALVKNLNGPDIVGLTEVQDNNGPTDDGTVAADESYQAVIKAIEAAGGPSYKFASIAPVDKMDGGQPGGNIRVGFLYNPERVSLTDKPKGDAVTAVEVNKDGLTLNPGRVAPMDDAFNDSRKPLAAEFKFNGEKVIVIVNHFNSKGGDGALFGAEHPVVLGSEAQRVQQAEVVNDFVEEIDEEVKRENVVVLGDLNDFTFSDPVQTLAGDDLTNMIEELPTEDRYSYIYQGNSQVLDHILVSDHLKKDTKIDAVHINADFSEASGRASDHDPILAQIHVKKGKGTHPDFHK